MARRYSRDVAWVTETLIEAYLQPEALWFLTFVDRRDRTMLSTANRHYTSLDEPERPIDPALDAILQRWEAGDSELVVVPRMPNAEREAHMLAFVETIVDPAARAAFDARARAMRARWEDHWRPLSFHHLADDLRWRARIVAAADEAVTRFCVEQDIDLEGLVYLAFD